MMMELRDGNCYPKVLLAVNVFLAFVDGLIGVYAFFQLMMIHSRNSQIGWTRQKVFHLMIGSSNMGYFLYFLLTPVAVCKGWLCWSHSCGFIFMAFPKILFLAAFLLLLSYWVDLCNQSNDDDDEEEEGSSPRETLLEKMKKPNLSSDGFRRCCSFRIIHVGSRQKVVILVTVLFLALMITSAVLIWIGMGRNPIDSAVVARVYVDVVAIAMLVLGGALAGYGSYLSMKMRKVRSERVSSEMWKIAGLAIVSVLCFMSSAIVALFTDIPMLYYWHQQSINGVFNPLLLILYYFIGSSVPSAFVLWVMREVPSQSVVNIQEESRTITFVSDESRTVHPQHWTVATSLQNQVSRASPI